MLDVAVLAKAGSSATLLRGLPAWLQQPCCPLIAQAALRELAGSLRCSAGHDTPASTA